MSVAKLKLGKVNRYFLLNNKIYRLLLSFSIC